MGIIFNMPKCTKRSKPINVLLDTLEGAGVISLSLIAPNLAKGFGKTYIGYLDKKQKNREAKYLLNYMKRQDLINIEEVGGGQINIRITSKGRLRLKKTKYESLEIKKPKKWDKRWRIVMFDIPNGYDMQRRNLVAKLQEMGFKMLQKSIWVHPFECRDEIEVIKNFSPEIAKYLIFLETDNLDIHNKLTKKFKAQLLN